MDLGVALPTSGRLASPANIVRIAQEAERQGYAAVWTYERLLRPMAQLPAPDGSMRRIPEQYRLTYEPLETLSFVAGKTERVKLGTSVIDAAAPTGGAGSPLRHPGPAQRRAGRRRAGPGLDAPGVRGGQSAHGPDRGRHGRGGGGHAGLLGPGSGRVPGPLPPHRPLRGEPQAGPGAPPGAA